MVKVGFFNGAGGSWWEQQFWGGGQLLGHYDGSTTYFIHRSDVGSSSPTQITTGSGSLSGDETFYPWGQQWEYDNEANSWWQFYGGISRYQADLNLYLTPHRFYSSSYGRWLTPDPSGRAAVSLTDPQTWNMYAYALNNPATLNDPSGLCTAGQGGCVNQQGTGACKAGDAHCHPISCSNMDCADHYYGGENYFGGCTEWDIPVPCSPDLGQEGLVIDGTDIFSAASGEPGTYLIDSGPQINSSGRAYTGTGGWGFSTQGWINTEVFIEEAYNQGFSDIPTSGYVTYQDLSPVQSAATGSLAYGSYGFIPSLYNTLGNIQLSRNFSTQCAHSGSGCEVLVKPTPGASATGLQILGIAKGNPAALIPKSGSELKWQFPYP